MIQPKPTFYPSILVPKLAPKSEWEKAYNLLSHSARLNIEVDKSYDYERSRDMPWWFFEFVVLVSERR